MFRLSENFAVLEVNFGHAVGMGRNLLSLQQVWMVNQWIPRAFRSPLLARTFSDAPQQCRWRGGAKAFKVPISV